MKFLNQIGHSVLVLSLAFSPSAFARPVQETDIQRVEKSFIQASPTATVAEITQMANLTEGTKVLSDALNSGVISQDQFEVALNVAQQIQAQGRSTSTLTKAEMENLVGNSQNHNPALYLVALLPLAIAFIGIWLSSTAKEHDAKVEHNHAVQKAQEREADANARAAEAEARVKEAEAKLKEIQAQERATHYPSNK